MTITDIKDYGKGKFEVYLNDEFAFTLCKSELNKFNMRVGEELSDDAVQAVKEEVLTKRAKKRAMNLLLKGDMTQSRLYTKLKDNRYPDDVIEAAIEYVKSFGYIDDRRYAQNFISSKAGASSKSVIRMKLIDKGVDKHIIDEELNTYYEDELNGDVESELIKKLIIKKCSDVSQLDYEGRQKLIASLMRKGFTYSQIDKCIENWNDEL